MKNLHKINHQQFPEWVRLFATRWHIESLYYPQRRIGKLFWNGRDIIIDSFYASDHTKINEDTIENYTKRVRKNIPITMFKEDMITYEKPT